MKVYIPQAMNRTLKNEKFLLLAILIFAFLLRLQFLKTVKNDPAFLMPIVDSLEYDTWARDILHGNILWQALQYHPPLYPYFLAGIYKVFGYSMATVALLQYLIGALSCGLVYFIAKRLANKATAAISGIFMATYWFFIYVQSFLFSENLSCFMNILLVYNLLAEKENKRKYFISGIIFGFSVISRTEILLFVLLVLVWLFSKKIPWDKIAQFYLFFVLGFLIIVAPVVFRNYQISGEFPVIRTQVGSSLYLGNHPDFKGTSINLGIGSDWENFIYMPSRALKRQANESEADRFFVNEVLKFIRQQPGRWLKLIAGKIFSVWSGRDFLTSEDVYFYDNYVASSLTRAVSTRMIFILAVAGIILSFKFHRSFLLLYIFIISEMPIMFFLIKTRYLISIAPFIIIFSAYSLNRLYRCLKNKNLVTAVLIVFIICVLNLLSYLNPNKITLPDISQTYYAIAKNFNSRGKLGEAAEYYSRCLQLDPRNISAYNDLGVLFLNIGDCERAVVYFNKALSIDRNAVKPFLNYRLCEDLLAKNRKEK